MSELRLSLAIRCAGVAVAAAAWCATAADSRASEARLLPFFSKPYPFGYARPTRAPDADCWVYRQVNGLFGSHVERVWVCGSPLIERY